MRKLTLGLVALCLFASLPAASTRAEMLKPVAKCPKTLADCPGEGCTTGHEVDGNLNRRKNITTDDPEAQGDAEPLTLREMKALKNPKHFVKGGSRDELEALGEGKLIRVTAFLLTARREGSESCNCGLNDEKKKDKDVGVNTDNHLVLVSGSTVKKFSLPAKVNTQEWKENLAKRERESITAELTPRVRLDHPNFTRAAVRPLILKARQMALPVRVSGVLMFDSQHFLENSLVRVNNWEIHPILKLEFCPKGASCTADSDDDWQSLDDL
jgi:hypothetical protein